MSAATAEIDRRNGHDPGHFVGHSGSSRVLWWRIVPLGHWLMVPVLLLAGLLRTQQLSTVGVQCDESFIQKMVEFSWGEMFDRIGRDTHPPLFHMMFKVWTRIFGVSVVAGRSLTAFWGIAAVAGMYAFIRRAYRRDDRSERANFREADLPAIVAALLLAMAPLQVFWSMQIRMYSLSVALTLWSSYMLVRALASDDRINDERPGWKLIPRWEWTVYTVTAVLLAYSHHFGLFVLAAQYVYAFGYRWFCGTGGLFDRISPVLISGTCLFFAWEPGLVFFLEQHRQVTQSFYLPKPSWTVLGNLTHELWAGYGVPISSTTGLIISQISFVALMLLAAGRRPADYLVLLSAVLPVTAAFTISSFSQSVLNARYFLLTQVFFMAAAAIVACRMPRLGRYAVIGLLMYSLSSLCQAHYLWRDGAAKLPGMQAAVARIDAARSEEPLVVCNPMLYTSVLTYTHDRKQVYLTRSARDFPFFQGTAVIRDEEYADSDWLEQSPASFVWTLDADESMGRVLVPRGWNLKSEERYQEWYAGLIVRLYSRNQ